MSLNKLLTGVDVLEVLGNREISVIGLTQDSRRVRSGELFLAVRGQHVDGHRFVAEAVKNGAAAVMVEAETQVQPGATVVRVADGRRAMAQMAANFFHHPSRDLRLIGITGTNGKTTTVALLESILKVAGNSTGVIGTLNYHWPGASRKAVMTTPDAPDLQALLAAMRGDGVNRVVMEVSSHALALGRVEGLFYSAAAFTNLSQDHLDFHKTMEDYFQAKQLLFTRHLIEPQAPAIVNMDDPYGRRLAAGIDRMAWGYGIDSPDATVQVTDMELSATGIRVRLATPNGPLKLTSRLLGRLNLYNVLCAVTTALALEVEPGAVVEGVAALDAVDGRLQRVDCPLGFEVVVDYAHTPDAMEKALECLRELTHRRLFVVFGCGGDRDRTKRPLMGAAAARWGDRIVMTTDNPRTEDPEGILDDIEPGVQRTVPVRLEPEVFVSENGDGKVYTIVPDRGEAIEMAVRAAREGDLIYIGGKGHETYQIVGRRVLPFDDRRVARRVMEQVEVRRNRGAG